MKVIAKFAYYSNKMGFGKLIVDDFLVSVNNIDDYGEIINEIMYQIGADFAPPYKNLISVSTAPKDIGKTHIILNDKIFLRTFSGEFKSDKELAEEVKSLMLGNI